MFKVIDPTRMEKRKRKLTKKNLTTDPFNGLKSITNKGTKSNIQIANNATNLITMEFVIRVIFLIFIPFLQKSILDGSILSRVSKVLD